jgi:hypothetical protein
MNRREQDQEKERDARSRFLKNFDSFSTEILGKKRRGVNR